MDNHTVDLVACARQEMIQDGFDPDFPPAVAAELAAAQPAPFDSAASDVADLRGLCWSSIDNDTSKDLDQIEVAERVEGGIRVRVGIADVDSLVKQGSAIDKHASDQTTTVYALVVTFPMLPLQLSTDRTSLNEDQDRPSLVIEYLVGPDGTISAGKIYRAMVHNRAQLVYEEVGAWLEGTGPAPAKVAASADLAAQLRLQDEAAGLLRKRRHELGAIDFDRPEMATVETDGKITDIRARQKDRASGLIEDFMIAANTVMAQTLSGANVSNIRRVVKTPERWSRIVDLAAQHNWKLPADPDSGALASFLAAQKQSDPAHYPDLSLAVVKLMGSGEYVLLRPGDDSPGHFGLAAHDYTHSTAPNRRFADMVTQRLIKSVLDHAPSPYTDDQLDAIAKNCTAKEDAARKVERSMAKRVAALALAPRVGQSFDGVVTGVTPKGVFVRVFDPPVEGRLMRGEQGLDVGDTVHVQLLNTDAERGFIDFGR